jgi:hypothetical protein
MHHHYLRRAPLGVLCAWALRGLAEGDAVILKENKGYDGLIIMICELSW